jgi:hypothetical protein
MLESAHLVPLLWAPTAKIVTATLPVWSAPLDGLVQLAVAVLRAIQGPLVRLAQLGTTRMLVSAVYVR